jgi:hypothetical protein
MVRVMRYLKYTLNYGLHYTRYPFVLREYNEVNWIFVSKDTKSMSGYVFTFGGAAVSWKSTKTNMHCEVYNGINAYQFGLSRKRSKVASLFPVGYAYVDGICASYLCTL